VGESRTAVSESSAITPERQPLATLARDLRDRLHPVRFHPETETPLSRGGGGHRAPHPAGTRDRGTDWRSG
jgi:hypothetical protein